MPHTPDRHPLVRYLSMMWGGMKKNSVYQSHPVGQKKPNPWGLYDMQGNVWNGSRTGLRTTPQTMPWILPVPAAGQPISNGRSQVTVRIGKGGSWYSAASSLRISNRGVALPRERTITRASAAPGNPLRNSLNHSGPAPREDTARKNRPINRAVTLEGAAEPGFPCWLRILPIPGNRYRVTSDLGSVFPPAAHSLRTLFHREFQNCSASKDVRL